MTPQTFCACLDQIGWSLRGLAGRLGMAPTTMRRWADGSYPVPTEVARWLARLADAHLRNPAPYVKDNEA